MVNANWVNTNLHLPGAVNTDCGPGPVNTNWRPSPVYANRGQGLGAESREIQRPCKTSLLNSVGGMGLENFGVGQKIKK